MREIHDDVIYVDFEDELKPKASDKIKKKFKAFGQWVKNNKEEIIVLAPICIGGASLLYKIVKPCVGGIAKNVNLRKAEKVKELYCYDPSLGHYWKLNRKLTNDEWIRVDKLRQSGQRLSDILNDMNVLK